MLITFDINVKFFHIVYNLNKNYT